jgi:hypothetical protein
MVMTRPMNMGAMELYLPYTWVIVMTQLMNMGATEFYLPCTWVMVMTRPMNMGAMGLFPSYSQKKLYIRPFGHPYLYVIVGGI